MMHRQNGTTLIETLVSAAILSVIALTLAGLASMITDQFTATRLRLETELHAARAEKVLREYFSQGIDFGTADFTSDNDVLGTTTGIVRGPMNATGYLFDKINDMATDWNTIALFIRDTSTLKGTDNLGSHLVKTGVWFRRPSKTTTGVLFFDSVDADTGPAETLYPQYGEFTRPGHSYDFIENISHLQIIKNQVPNYSKLSSLDFVIRFRYHVNLRGGTNWCPTADINAGTNGCGASTAVYRDVESRFRILLQNALINPVGAGRIAQTAVQSEERVMGNLYFFRMILPRVWN